MSCTQLVGNAMGNSLLGVHIYSPIRSKSSRKMFRLVSWPRSEGSEKCPSSTVFIVCNRTWQSLEPCPNKLLRNSYLP
jgi:hypothetical protein